MAACSSKTPAGTIVVGVGAREVDVVVTTTGRGKVMVVTGRGKVVVVIT